MNHLPETQHVVHPERSEKNGEEKAAGSTDAWQRRMAEWASTNRFGLFQADTRGYEPGGRRFESLGAEARSAKGACRARHFQEIPTPKSKSPIPSSSQRVVDGGYQNRYTRPSHKGLSPSS